MKQKNPKNPVSMFYWIDWLNDPALKLCSFAAKGLWMDCLSLAATCTPFGHLAVDGRPLTAGDLQLMLPGHHDEKEIAALLHELVKTGTASRSAKGIIYSRRMVRDARARILNERNGQKGGNPTLRNKRQKGGADNPPVNPPHNPNTFSNSFSFKKEKMNQKEKEICLATEDFACPDYDFNEKAAEITAVLGDDIQVRQWLHRVYAYFERGFWLETLGAKPGEKGCLAPAEIVEALKPKEKMHGKTEA